ncbi:hypothetical protein GTO89_02455 [Heliobacterium gestii]|uniref:Uncharacterized protein n=1 Tax=Heliomicrobium gestii TaxID=2699 RepID=A0A845L9G1_HELGE|nr:hypothetical protein [Heliomicrobium gestii]MBM7865644.1 hypothetical protein [Heliomicrobium gestii]MZP41894.1 hypothetical protein [Heliomicrobium gestii]
MSAYNLAARRLFTLLSACADNKDIIGEVAARSVERWAEGPRSAAAGYVGLTGAGRELLQEIGGWDIGDRQVPQIYRQVEALAERSLQFERMRSESAEAYRRGGENALSPVHIAPKEKVAQWLEETKRAVQDELFGAINNGDVQQLRQQTPPDAEDINALFHFLHSLREVKRGKENVTNIQRENVFAIFHPETVVTMDEIKSSNSTITPEEYVGKLARDNRFYCIPSSDYESLTEQRSKIGLVVGIFLFAVLYVAYAFSHAPGLK